MDADKHAVALKLNRPFSTSEPLLRVRGLVVPGDYEFRLVVSDGAGNHSQPAFVRITVDRPVTTWLRFRSAIASARQLFSKFIRP